MNQFDSKIKDYLDRFAGSPKRPQSFVFYGPDSAGKLEAAFYFIQKICGRSDDVEFARRLEEKIHPDIISIEPQIAEDKKGRTREREITIEQIRNAQAQMKFFPYELNFKFCLVKKAERLNQEASNALLKSLEEPTEKTIFILLAANIDLLLPTIISRCTAVRFPDVELPKWSEENRGSLRNILSQEIHEKFDWAQMYSKERITASEILSDWESVLAEGLRNLAKENTPNAGNKKRLKLTVEMLEKNRQALNRIIHTNANARTILENLLLELEWK